MSAVTFDAARNCLCDRSQDREPGPPFDPRKEGDHNIEAMMEGLAVSTSPFCACWQWWRSSTPLPLGPFPAGMLQDQGLSTNKKLREELMIKLGAKQPDGEGRVWSSH